ncbi:hypothetical protein FOXG_19702 [Fusarium oxysporum f. sp. lycopersici 4287]|uniref:Uncharacterized protein n=1 Tax=Fusarium oxysporum f. sp. lycopersici (strain 4287 / CBS 123668 / FGSC 9935 / NRRL 34936) TaxID=426428 RepID=A0A0J9UZQ5_FUSO4|nr:hypothetical protein FOXG_19337 [Fusarium oxysporum f. sp. lycopersici 4287]XP_018244568.1 hypothetical protein FOXG_19702 [Fusarium oxysporum f. sp. lycopersici 4287]KNB04590.1 hypothetical protein FOXG_19337 [Fusarium oxysporum f. sp. lycopersici 4287]KNB06523.1 hypothetical protein FOXG_19702 [Fusarium oxysporum f. sp. lycopersici 4287]
MMIMMTGVSWVSALTVEVHLALRRNTADTLPDFEPWSALVTGWGRDTALT